MKTRVNRIILVVLLAAISAPAQEKYFQQARENGRRFDQMAFAMQRVLKAWLSKADPQTLLLPDRLPGGQGWRGSLIYTPHNSGADLYPFLILTAHLTDPEIYKRRMMRMLRNEIRYASEGGMPVELDLKTRARGEPRIFDAAEYAKDGLVAVTELLGRTPWFYRLVDMTIDMMQRASVRTRFGLLPASDAETNGDALQTLVRLAVMTSDKRFIEWARRIGDAYVEEVLPGNYGLPSHRWDFDDHVGERRLRLRDHGNEIIVGLSLLYAVEQYHDTERAARYRPALARMFDRILESANEDGMFFDVIDAETLRPIRRRISDNWGYVYAAAYTFYQATGDGKYRDAVRRALKNLARYTNHDWQNGSMDGMADSIESALYLASREPVEEALEWIEAEVDRMVSMQRRSGFVERWYCDGNFNRTLLMYILYKSQGCRPDRWIRGLRIGAARDGQRLYLSIESARRWRGVVRFDFARHKRVIGFDKNYARLNEFPEWYTVDENALYKITGARERVALGSELVAGIRLTTGRWIIEPVKPTVKKAPMP